MKKLIFNAIFIFALLEEQAIAIDRSGIGRSYAYINYTDIENLLDQRQYSQAYEIAKQRALSQEGDPFFDFLYGKAALYSNHPDIAVFALERSSRTRPHHLTFMELGRAHLKLRDLGSAEKAFRQVKNSAIAIPYLSQIAALKEAQSWKKFLNFEVGGGYDSNVDNVWSNNVGGFKSHLRSWLNQYIGSAGVIKELSDRKSTIFGSANMRYRENYTAHRFDVLESVFELGYSTRLGEYGFAFPFKYSHMLLGDRPFSDTYRIKAEVKRSLDKKKVNTLILSGEFAQINYPNIKIRNTRRGIYIGEWIYTPSEPYALTSKLFYSNGRSLDPTGQFLVGDYYGVEFNAKWKGIKHHTPYLTLNYTRSPFNARDPVFRVTRISNLYMVQVGWDYNFAKNFTLAGSYMYNNGISNIAFFTFNRHFFQIALKGHFNE